MLIQFLLTLGFVLALWITWKRYRQNVITLLEACGWSALWLAGAIVSLLPRLTQSLAVIFGVGRGVDLILYAAVAIQFFLIFKLFISHEKLEHLLTKLVQDNALKNLSFRPEEQERRSEEALVNSSTGPTSSQQDGFLPPQE